jgi:transcriptional regulator with XRE-family HTH domain
VRALLDMREWSEYDLAKASGVAQKTINNILNRRSVCGIETADSLAAAFGLKGWQLLIPDLPDDVLNSPALGKLVEDWAHSSTEGREHVNRVAEKEAKYNAK